MSYLSTTRRVHLDFHTPGFIENVAEKFDAAEFAKTLEESGVQALAAFAKCHYGNAYYPTSVGIMHPGLGFDLLGSIVTACAERGIHVAAYYSLQCDNHFCHEHPDCEQVRVAGEPASGFWHVPCINSPYREYAKAQIAEIAARYPVAGLWIDIVGYYPACLCPRCVERYEREAGKPAPKIAAVDEDDPNYVRYVHWQRGCVDSFIRELRDTARAENPRIVLCANTSSGVYEKASGAFDVDEDHLVEEACTSSNASHYTYTSYFSRLFDSDPKKRPFEIVTQRFHQGWGDWSLRPPDWLKFEVATITANGGKASIGDQLYPEGRWEPEVYRTVAEVYAWLGERESVLGESVSAAEAAIYLAGIGVHRDPGGIHTQFGRSASAEGAFRALLDSQYPVDLITRANLPEGSGRYRVVLIDQPLAPSADELSAFDGYLRSGGNLIYVLNPEMLDG